MSKLARVYSKQEFNKFAVLDHERNQKLKKNIKIVAGEQTNKKGKFPK
jgi:hypothetical protein